MLSLPTVEKVADLILDVQLGIIRKGFVNWIKFTVSFACLAYVSTCMHYRNKIVIVGYYDARDCLSYAN